jgi:hypothetical protein
MTGTKTPSAPAQELTQQNIEQLKSRLERAEGQMKGLRFTVLGLAVLAVVALFMQLDKPFMQLDKPTVISAKTVNAESFSVRNTKGDIVAQMGADSDGSPSIAFLDANKKIRLMVSVGASGPSVSLLDPEQIYRATLSLNEKSDPSLTLSNSDKAPRSVFAIDKGGSGHLVLYGTAGGLDLAANEGRVRWTPSTGGAPVDALPVTK